MLTAPGSLVVVVKVEPALSVLIMTTGMSSVKPSVETRVTVDGAPVTVVVLSRVIGNTRSKVAPLFVVVTVTVDSDNDSDSTVVVIPADPLADCSPRVTVVVTCVARLLAKFSAFLKAEAGIGVPAMSQRYCKGVNNKLVSRELSQLPCIQVIRSGKKFPADARHCEELETDLELLWKEAHQAAKV